MAYPATPGPDFSDDPAFSSFASGLLGWLGAALSVSLVVGLIWWAYDIAVRDTRTIPVVRAMEGPARVQPENPGGFQAPHRGYAVNEIAGEQSRSALSEEIALAPAPDAVTEEDAPITSPGSAPGEDTIRSSVDRAVLDALGLSSEAEPAADGAASESANDVLRPMPRPRAAAEVSRALSGQPVTLAAASATAAIEPVAAQDIPAGTRLVQLGAFEDQQGAEQAWIQLSGSFSEYFGDKRPVFEQTAVGGVSIWRLRALGFEDRAEARRFCEVLLAAQAECIPVLTR